MKKLSQNTQRKQREWIKEFVKEEIRHGYKRKTAEKRALEVIHNLSLVKNPKSI